MEFIVRWVSIIKCYCCCLLITITTILVCQQTENRWGRHYLKWSDYKELPGMTDTDTKPSWFSSILYNKIFSHFTNLVDDTNKLFCWFFWSGCTLCHYCSSGWVIHWAEVQEDGTVTYGERQDNWPLPVDNIFVWILLILLSHCVGKSKSCAKKLC